MNGESRKVIMLVYELAVKLVLAQGRSPFLLSAVSLPRFAIHKPREKAPPASLGSW
jgi:hypothetical protein